MLVRPVCVSVGCCLEFKDLQCKCNDEITARRSGFDSRKVARIFIFNLSLQDSSVGIVSRLWAGRLRNYGLIRGSDKRFYPFKVPRPVLGPTQAPVN
jgi:hypothetical protein